MTDVSQRCKHRWPHRLYHDEGLQTGTDGVWACGGMTLAATSGPLSATCTPGEDAPAQDAVRTKGIRWPTAQHSTGRTVRGVTMLAAVVGGSKNNSPESRIKCEHEVTEPLLPLQGGATAKPHRPVGSLSLPGEGTALSCALRGLGPTRGSGLRESCSHGAHSGPVATGRHQTFPISTPPDGLPGPTRGAHFCVPGLSTATYPAPTHPAPHFPCPPLILPPVTMPPTCPALTYPVPHSPCPPLTLSPLTLSPLTLPLLTLPPLTLPPITLSPNYPAATYPAPH